jgi:hypothetical protein
MATKQTGEIRTDKRRSARMPSQWRLMNERGTGKGPTRKGFIARGGRRGVGLRHVPRGRHYFLVASRTKWESLILVKCAVGRWAPAAGSARDVKRPAADLTGCICESRCCNSRSCSLRPPLPRPNMSASSTVRVACETQIGSETFANFSLSPSPSRNESRHSDDEPHVTDF